jgi:hypothetical protein
MGGNYFIFDMDETLAELYPMFYFITSLRDNIPSDGKEHYDRAYDIFVRNILKQEVSSSPLGIVRPGILRVMEKLYALKRQGKIKDVVIYSNNGHLDSLHFIRDLIQAHIGSKNFIRECIDWNHPMRDAERLKQPGAAYKTWNVLKNILVEGNCKAPTNLEPSSVFFFDDLEHADLQRNLGPGNYFKVPPYTFRASFDRIADEYRKALDEADIEDNELESDIIYFRSKTQNTASREARPPPEDDGIKMMIKAIGMMGGHTRKRYRIITHKRRHGRSKKLLRKN